MRIRTLAGPPLEDEIITDLLRSILLTDASVSADERRDIKANAAEALSLPRPALPRVDDTR